jgi:hypothetical protein
MAKRLTSPDIGGPDPDNYLDYGEVTITMTAYDARKLGYLLAKEDIRLEKQGFEPDHPADVTWLECRRISTAVTKGWLQIYKS